MSNSPSAISGAFNFQYAQRDVGSVPRLSGAKSNLYQPPHTPTASASSSLFLSKSTASIISTGTSLASAGNRPSTKKRTLNDYHDEPPPTITDDWEKENNGRAEDWIPASPKPFVNTRYQLAGGMDTPTLAASSQYEERRYPEVGYRRSLSDVEMEDGAESVKTKRALFGEVEGPTHFALEREANGRGRGYPDQRRNGWGRGAYLVVGAVVGKALDFCRAGATLFTGFKAGGGQAYSVNELGSVARFEAMENDHNWESEKPSWVSADRQMTPLPGRFPEEDFIADYMDHPTPDDSPVRPSKRRQVSGGFRDEEIAKNWVVVSNSPSRPTPPLSQHRALPRPSHPNLAPRRPMVPASRPASRASFGVAGRRSVAPRGSHAGSPALGPTRGASFASPRSPASPSRIPRASPMRDVNRMQQGSPAEVEARQWKAMKKREDREADESIRRLDAQLKAMIREGREALGTKVEVLDDELEDTRSKHIWAL